MLPALFLAQVDEAMKVVDKAAAQNDRWLFLAAIIFIIVAFLIVIRYLVKDRDKERDARITENGKHQDWVVTVYTENVKMAANILVILQETNVLLARIEKILPRGAV
jgi:ascorbate-specific PTS system EIIC-type component UlaA